MKARWFLLLAGAAVALLLLTPLVWRVRRVSGVVYDISGQPIAGATVRVRATAYSTQTDSSGRFTLAGFAPAFKVRVTAWSDGYYVAGRAVWPWDADITLVLSPYAVSDNTSYSWIVPKIEGRSFWEEKKIYGLLDPAAFLAPDALFFKAAEKFTLGCRDCHAAVIYDQWIQSAHALGFNNPRFASMYNGTDLGGQNKSPLTRYGYSRDYGRFPLRPDLTQPYYGPGYKLDFPNTAGNCAACHLPAAALAAPYGTDPNTVTGVDALGSHCDFCHKIADVKLDSATGLPYENMPGVLSLVMMRPLPERQIFFGPYDDVDAGSDTYLPLQRQSEYCAPCHTARFWSVPIYDSFAEWKSSPYSDAMRAKAAGLSSPKSCQDCHMKPDGVTTNFAPGRGGQERAPDEIFTHTFPGASSADLLRNAVTMDVSAARSGDEITVTVTIVNDRTGHHVPTDSPLRQMILLVSAADGQGQVLSLREGPVIPDYGGVGDPAKGYYAGLPGKIYAKTLKELWTEISPTGAYWNPTRIVSDSRIPALGSDSSVYVFQTSKDSETSEVVVRVTLLFRRAFKELMDQKGWDVPDIVMAEETFRLR